MTRVLLLWILAVSLSSGICYDPDDYLTTPQIIRRHGYSVESHTILTDDGYLLTLHRITGSPNRRFHTKTPHQPTISYPTAVSENKTTTASYKMPPENSAATSYSQISLPPEPSTTTQTNSYYRERRIQRLKKFLLFAKNETIGIHQRWKQRGISLKLQNMVKYGATQTTSSTQTTTAAVTTPQAIIVQTTTQTTPSTQTTRPTMPTKTTVETITTTLQTTSIQATTPQTTSSTQATTPQTTTPKTTSLPTTTVSPSPPSSSPIFIQHGLLGSSADWIMAGPGRALAYLLADEGYDVWLGNARGNVYSKAHATLSTSDSKFWNFSWHEMGYYDLPAAIDYVINVTGSSSVVYIGHSMGTTMFYVMAASRPEYNAKIRAMFSLAPVAYVHYIKSPIRLIARYAHDVEFICHILGQNEFLPQGKIMNLLAKYGCLLVATEKIICENAIFLMTGFDAVQFDKALLPLILMHTPAGTSTKTVLHYAQEVQSGKFRQYDYGTRDNWKFYNQPSPPEYNLSLITAPIELYYAKNDWLATPKDVEEFYLKLKNRIGKYLVKLPQFNHLDFLWAKDVKTLVYDELIDRIKLFSPPLSEKKETLKVTSKWYSDIKGEYSHEKYPHEVRRNFQGLKR